MKTTVTAIPGGAEAKIELTSEVGGIIELGSAPHVIRAKNKKALFWEGADHPVRSVNHPGTRPRPVLRPAHDEEKQPLVDDLTSEIRRLGG